jgi:cytoskeleton protein RodZ
MEQFPENNAGQGGKLSAAAPGASLGRMLREARERLDLSVADVAAQIKFAPRQIEALEADDFAHLPEAAFLRGFVRSYAKILQLDAQTLLAALPQSKAAVAEQIPSSVNVPFPVAHSSQRQNLILLGAALLMAVIVVGFAVWHFTNPIKPPVVAKIETPVSLPAELPDVPAPHLPKQDTIEPPIPAKPKPRSAAAAEHSSALPAQPAALPTKSAPVQIVPKIQSTDHVEHSGNTMEIVKIRLVFDVESWAEIKDKDGNILSSRVHEPGSEMSLGRQPPLALVIGHAGSVHLFKNGEPVDLAPYTNVSSDVARLKLE